MSPRARLRAWRACGCTWIGDLYVAGRRERVPLGPDETAARSRLAQLVADHGARRVLVTAGPSFAQAARRFLEREAADPGARANSLASYRARVAHLERYFGERPITGIGAADVRELVESHLQAGRAPATVAGIYAALRSVLALAVDDGIIDVAPLPRRSPVPSPAARTRRLSLTDAARLVEAMVEPWRSAAHVVLLTGLRRGELLALRAGDLDSRGLARVERNLAANGQTGPPKTRSGRRLIPLSPDAQAILAERARAHPNGRLWPHTHRQAQTALNAALVAEGLYERGDGWHLLRRTHATLLDAAGLSLREAAARMGHGHGTAQTLAYGWAGETGEVGPLDETFKRHGAP